MVVLSRAFLHERFLLFTYLSYHTTRTLSTSRTSPSSFGRQVAPSRNSGVKTCRVAETRAQLPQPLFFLTVRSSTLWQLCSQRVPCDPSAVVAPQGFPSSNVHRIHCHSLCYSFSITAYCSRRTQPAGLHLLEKTGSPPLVSKLSTSCRPPCRS